MPTTTDQNKKMMVREDILAKLTTGPLTKIIEEPRQGDINLLEQELAEKAPKIKTTEDMVEEEKKWSGHRQPSGEMGHS